MRSGRDWRRSFRRPKTGGRPRKTDMRAFAEVYGLVFAAAIVSNAVGPMLLAAIYDLTGSYTVGIRVLGIAFGLAAAITFLLPRFAEVEAAGNDKLKEHSCGGPRDGVKAAEDMIVV